VSFLSARPVSLFGEMTLIAGGIAPRPVKAAIKSEVIKNHGERSRKCSTAHPELMRKARRKWPAGRISNALSKRKRTVLGGRRLSIRRRNFLVDNGMGSHDVLLIRRNLCVGCDQLPRKPVPTP